MAAWIELIQHFQGLKDNAEKAVWLEKTFEENLVQIRALCGDTNVVLYGSAFLQKPQAQQVNLQINLEDINGFMSVLHGMDCSKGLTLIMHTPGGMINATETIVAYLRSKFPNFIQVIIPTYAMSAGTMITLASDKIIMGRQSQMGPIDPQLPVNGRTVSALAIIDQFQEAEKKILENKDNAHVWAPILTSLGPALLQEAKRSIGYGKAIVGKWLEAYMFKDKQDKQKLAASVADHFSTSADNTNHGRRIDRIEARGQQLTIEDLETNQQLQEAVLTAYHLMTLIFMNGPSVKIIAADSSKKWLKVENTK